MEIKERRKTKRMEETELGGKQSGAEEREWKVGDRKPEEKDKQAAMKS